MIGLQIDDADLLAKLDTLKGRDLKRVVSRSIRKEATPVLRRARALVPIASGRLKASLGRLVETNRRKDRYTLRVGPRRDFTFRSRRTRNRVASGRGSNIDKAIAGGAMKDRVSVNQYAGGVEWGTKKDGSTARRKGGAYFLNQAMLARRQAAPSSLATSLRLEINRIANRPPKRSPARRK